MIIPVDESLTLRLVEPHLAREAFAVIDRNRQHIARWMSWPSQSNSPADVEAWIAKTLAEFAQRKELAMFVLDNGRIIGATGWNGWTQGPVAGAEFASADIGYWLAKDATGRGVMTRCVAKLLDVAFDEYALHRITIRCEPGNDASSGIAKRLGFTLEGIMRHVCRYADRWIDHELYSMLADEWAERKASRRQQ